jgi:hypothetical protein
MNSLDLEFDTDGRLLQVCVANWTDGSQIWRDILSSRKEEVVFEFRKGPYDHSTSYIISQVGLFPTFSVKEGRFYSTSGIRKEWADMAPYIRWFSNELGFFRWPSTPMSLHELSESDPFVAWFVDIDASLSEARALDEKLSRIKSVMNDSPPGITVKKAAEEIGEDSDLVEQILHFSDSMLEPAWVVPDWSKLAGRGRLSFSVRRPNHSYSGGNVGRKRHPGVAYSDLLTVVEAPSLVDFIATLSKMTTSSAVLIFRDRGDADDWFRSNSIKGVFTIPEEEIEVFKILDETIPYLLPNDEFSLWVMDRYRS